MPADPSSALPRTARRDIASPGDESEPKTATTSEGRVAWIDAGAYARPEARPEAHPEARRQIDPVPLVLVHGFTGHRDDFLPVLPALAERRRVIAYDLRGHGDSDSSSGSCGWSFEQLVMDLSAFLDELGLDRIDLLGHSMGGFVALRFALAHPTRVRSLIFLCTGPEPPATLSRSGFEKAAEIADARGMDGLQEIVETAGRGDASETIQGWGEAYWNHHRRRFGGMTASSYRGIGTAFFEAESLASRLGEIAVPCLVLVGEFDADWLPGAEIFERSLPVVRRTTLPKAEHHPHRENPAAFLEAVEDHLGSLGSIEPVPPDG